MPETTPSSYLLELEWSMGNGQCPECEALGPKFIGERSFPVGHQASCRLAKLMECFGYAPMYGKTFKAPPFTSGGNKQWI